MINIGIKIESKNIFPYMWVININKYETKKIKPLTYKELESFNNQTNPHTCGEELWCMCRRFHLSESACGTPAVITSEA